MNYFLVAGCMLLLIGFQKPSYGQGDFLNQTEKKVKDLINQMTIEEKIGQMTQIDLGVVSQGEAGRTEPHQLDERKLEEAILKYHVGSILNVINSAYSIDHWHEIIKRIQDLATKKTRLKIPVLYGIDAIHGANYIKEATLFPQHLTMAATWDPQLIRKEGEITALEMRAAGIPWNFNPVLDIGRQPLWPRLFETMGEDPFLASVFGYNYIKGLEGDQNTIGDSDKVASCLKHYIGYGLPVTGKDRTPAWIDERMLREYCLPPFRAGVEAGALTLMVNSSEINGIPVHSSYYLLTELLKKELGFEGFIVSDWSDINNLYERERIATSPKDAVFQAVMAGIDMSMVPHDFSFSTYLLDLVKEGKVPVSRIDDAVGRIMRVKFKLGLFTDPYPKKAYKKMVGCVAHRAISLQAAQEAITLLKNDKELLPLDSNLKVLVTGPTANQLSVLNSGWTYNWQGNQENLYPTDRPTILKAIESKIGKDHLLFAPGTDIEKEINIGEAVEKALTADVIVLCLGEAAYCETPGNINDLTLPEAQLRLAEALLVTGKPVVLVLAQGRPRVITRIADRISAILMAYLPGIEGGQAIADVIFGDVNPSGKLPITYPRYVNDLTCYDHKFSEDKEPNRFNPLFHFGHGLSYTRFTYSDLKINTTSIQSSDSLKIEVKVTNTGLRDGKETVQLYITDLYASITPSVRKLKAFKKVFLKPGQIEIVRFTITMEDLKFIGRNNRPVVESGEFELSIDRLKSRFTVSIPQ